MTTNALKTEFTLCSSLKGNSLLSRQREEDIWNVRRLRYTIVRINKDGSLPRRAMISSYNSADSLDKAYEVLARIASLNPGSVHAIVDRLEKVRL